MSNQDTDLNLVDQAENNSNTPNVEFDSDESKNLESSKIEIEAYINQELAHENLETSVEDEKPIENISYVPNNDLNSDSNLDGDSVDTEQIAILKEADMNQQQSEEMKEQPEDLKISVGGVAEDKPVKMERRGRRKSSSKSIPKEEIFDEVNRNYDCKDMRRPISVADIGMDCIAVHEIFGMDPAKKDNIGVIEDNMIVYAAGKAVVFVNLLTGKKQYLLAVDEGGIGCVAVHPSR
jgi:hypothetical protein